jgi:uncharacterized membrane protein
MSLAEWLNAALRWIHLIAGIGWIGSSFYFIWLDRNLERPREARDVNVEGSLWMVHSGGFYRVERRVIGPGRIPATLHWFKWEAAITWLSGASLLVLVYYATGGLFLLDPARSSLGVGAAVALGAGTIVFGWFAYDALWLWAEGRHDRLALVVSLAILAGDALALSRVLSGRASFLHVGSLLGTIMAANVWIRILPAQSRMIRATERGEDADLADSRQAKRRSVHNTYLTFPLLFLMLSTHYPEIWGHEWNALLLLLIVAAGMSARHLMVGGGRGRYWAAAPLVAATAALVVLVPSQALISRSTPAFALPKGAETPTFTQVQAVVLSRCAACHSSHPRIATFGAAPAGVNFDDPAAIRRYAPRIRVRVVETKTMPPGNMTAMSEEERLLVSRWLAAGAPDGGPYPMPSTR